MEKGFVENGFIINLSNSKNTNQLVYELSNIMEHPDVKGKRVCLKLGGIDLKQSQLLSIKALIEATDAGIAFIDTTSEQTEAAAVSLGIMISKMSDEMQHEPVTPQTPEGEPVVVKEELITEEVPLDDSEGENEDKVVEVDAGLDMESDSNPINTIEGVEDTFTEMSEHELSEIIPSEHFENEFERLAASEGLISNDEISKYILLDTGEVLPQGAEEHSYDTKELPTLYLNQTLRSGQTVTYEGNILIIGDAHPGSEIIADGDITVWGILGGIAHAGAKGNITSKVRALKLNAIQLRIAGLYARRNDTLNVPYVQKTNEFTPEEAQIEEGKIVIYKKLRRD
jgi:septum site-determining protein MinC